MIVNALYLRDFMRFEELRITQIPSRGVIGIVGENESGKSTILEAIAFGLFGQTLKASTEEYPRLIHWRASSMEVRLDVSFAEHAYRVVRTCDRQGGREARLFLIDAEREELLLSGVEQVNARLQSLMRLEFSVFSHSFYLGQKQLSALMENRSGSLELMEQMTGLKRLREVHSRLQSDLPGLEEQAQSLMVRLHVSRARVEHYAEQLEAAQNLQGDLQKNQSELQALEKNVQEESRQLGALEAVKRSLLSLRSHFGELKTLCFGLEFKRRLGLRGREFLDQLRAAEARVEVLQKESDQAQADLKSRLLGVEGGMNLLQSLSGLKLLMEERVREIKANGRSQYDATRIRSHYLPDTLKDKSIILSTRHIEGRDLISRETRAYNLALVLLLTYLGGTIYLGYRFGPEGLLQLNLMFKVGLGLFLASVGLLLIALLLYKNKSLKQLREAQGALEVNQGLVERELEDEQGEIEILEEFEPRAIHSLEDLRSLRQKVRKDSMKKVITRIMQDFADQPEAFGVPLRELEETRKLIAEQEQAERTRQLELESLKGVIGEYAALREEVEAYPFLPESQGSSEYSIGGILNRAREVQRLKELLQGDFSFAASRLEHAFENYEATRKDLVQKAREVQAWLPARFDERRLVWPYAMEQLGALDLPALLSKAREADECRAWLDQLLDEWFTCWQQKREKTMVAEINRTATRSRIEHVNHEISRMDSVQKRRAEALLSVDDLQAELQKLQHEIALNKTTETLIRGTIDSLRARLSPNLSRFIGVILPRMTSGRYSRVRVSLDLEISVYSSEKEGYVDFTTLSGGTADQLLLCLHLAFASALVQSRFDEDYRQFLFLDEPLAAFDSSRSSQFLEMILDFHKAFGQVFLISHNQHLSDQFDALIQTDSKAILQQNLMASTGEN